MGLAYLPDGTLIDYTEYLHHPHWQKVKQSRFDFDGGRCVICHKDLHDKPYQTHHLHYQRLGNERIRDVITLCPGCHKDFHDSWQRQNYWKGKESGHWEVFNLEHTARLCMTYWQEDKFISRNVDNPNLCSDLVCRDLIDRYFRENEISRPVRIDPHDISLFVRNKRYELFFNAEDRGLTVEQFLDEYFGEKVRGKNPLRRDAGRKDGPFDHTPESFHRHYLDNNNINILMEEVRNLEEHTESVTGSLDGEVSY